MNQKREKFYRGLFLFSAMYDFILGIVFMFFFKQAFTVLGIGEKLPEFSGYISLIGAFLFVIGIAYFLIYRGDLRKNVDLIAVGAFYKLAYCSIVFFYFAIGNIPHVIFIALFGILDFIMFILMLECYLFLKKKQEIK